MQLVNYRKDSLDLLGVQYNDWLIDLQRASDHIVGNERERYDRSHKYRLTPDSIPEYVGDSPRMQEARQSISYIQGASPEMLEELQSEAILLRLDQVSINPPVTNPGKVICVGMNYPEPGSLLNQRPAYPVLFLKPSSTLTGHQSPIALPEISKEVFCEGELAVVIGKACKHISGENALSYVAGYTIANDVGARDLEQRTSQWTTGKLSDTFCPMGPALVTADEIAEPDKLSIQAHINGTLVQSGNTSQMIFNVPYMISYISSITTLHPGDIILTGSPKSLNDRPAPLVYLKPGDNISIEIEGIGVLSNYAVQEEYPDV